MTARSFILVFIICGAALTIEVTLPLFMKITTNMGPVFEIRGGSGGYLCFPRGPRNLIFYKLFQASKHDYRTNTCYKNKWVTIKAVPVA